MNESLTAEEGKIEIPKQWTFIRDVRTEQQGTKWYALITCDKSGVEESFYLKFGEKEPTDEQIVLAAEEYVLKLNLNAAVSTGFNVDANTPLTRYEFRSRFTLDERIVIDNYESNTEIGDIEKAIVRTILKDFESTDTVHLNHPAVIQALEMLESFGLLAKGRAAKILGV